MSETKRTREWSAEDKELLDDVMRLISLHAENGFGGREDEDEDGQGEVGYEVQVDASDMTVAEFVDALMDELEEIRENNSSFMEYYLASASGDVSVMMGLSK